MLEYCERGSTAPREYREKKESGYGTDQPALRNHRSYLLDQFSPKCGRGRKTFR
jgi:hypothetical protein